MAKFNMSNLVKTADRYLRRNASSIWLGMSIVGFVSASVCAVDATVKAVKHVEEVEKETGEKMDGKGIVKECSKFYIAPVSFILGSTALTIMADKKNSAKYAAAVSIAKAAEEVLSDRIHYEMDYLGKKKINEIDEKVSQNITDRMPDIDYTKVYIPDDMDLCLEPITGRYFAGNKVTLDAAVNAVNSQLNDIQECDMNLFFEHLDSVNLECCEIGAMVGWNREKTKQISARLIPTTARDGKLCWVINYLDRPFYGYEMPFH